MVNLNEARELEAFERNEELAGFDKTKAYGEMTEYQLFGSLATECAWKAWLAARRAPAQQVVAVSTIDSKLRPAAAVSADGLETAAARWQYIEDNATSHGGGHGFTITCFVPVDHEDMGCGIDAAILAQQGAT